MDRPFRANGERGSLSTQAGWPGLWFDKVFRRADGPAHWAQAKLVRYADDFVVLARTVSPKLRGFIETKLETWMGLEINRDKTRVPGPEAERGQSGLSGVYVSI